MQVNTVNDIEKLYYDFESFLKPHFQNLPGIQKYQYFWFKRSEPEKIFTQKEAEGEFQYFDIFKNKYFNVWALIAIFFSKPLLLAH
ncbi:6609_t:CDS:2 [Funneliformis mosseae]|uniref:6609_t:CDS:1 n=1 Tax=Funneliformis mosseae TaxID=27381 RepID=A0A9N9GPL4_FUNMO|nr:6609_t:CDS:2 [Funneliformis mosseae]